jgi:hypothetical protein
VGGVSFHSTSIEIGPPARTIGVSANCLSEEPVQTVDFLSGYQQVRVEGMCKPPNAEGELAAIIAACQADENTLTTPGASFRVFKGEDYSFHWELSSSVSGLIYFSVSFNCLS